MIPILDRPMDPVAFRYLEEENALLKDGLIKERGLRRGLLLRIDQVILEFKSLPNTNPLAIAALQEFRDCLQS